jgi:bifunctional non-homologous end joining protein LigD
MARKQLKEYERKRDFERTPEPKGKTKRGGSKAAGKDDRPAASGRFVVQEHHATNLHWDLRLEHAGVAASWALPKGVPQHPKENRLAVHTEDHPLEYLEFEGEIPKGEYGAGTMGIWDAGTYEAEKFRDDEVILTFSGERVKGRYALFQTNGKNWMIHRMDPPADPEREPMPTKGIKPMMAALSKLPSDDENWAYELKWDGVRAIAYCDAGHLRLESRNLRDVTSQYPEARAVAIALGARQVILDGEIVAFNDEGRPDFQALQGRMHLASEAAVRRRVKDTPVTYVIFDVLHLDGRDLRDLPYTARRARLEALELEGPSWQTPTSHVGDGKALLDLTTKQGLEGVVAKRLDSRYLAGRRSSAWRKVKNTRTQDMVIGGWMPGEGRREKTVGALCVGYYAASDPSGAYAGSDPSGSDPTGDSSGLELRYAGRVGTGFTEATLRQLSALLVKLRTDDSPFTGRQPPKEAIFVEPKLVCEVEFREWTQARTLRAPSFKGLRDDRKPTEIRFEPEETSPDASERESAA